MSDLIRKSDAAREMWKHANGKTVLGGQTYQSLTLEVALDAIAALPAVTVGVKPLVWEAGERDQRRADSILGEFCVTFFGGRWFYQGEPRKGMLDAQAAAQADYEARILAALEGVAAPDLSDPVTVHANMLRGTIAKPTVEQIIHLYGVDALTKALAPVIVREAGIEPVAAPDPAAIREAALREAAAEAEAEGWLHQQPMIGFTEREEGSRDCAERIASAILALIPKGTAE